MKLRAVSLLFFLACGLQPINSNAANDGKESTSKSSVGAQMNQSIFSSVDLLCQKHSFDPTVLAELLHMKFQLKKEESSPPYWDMYRACSLSGDFSTAELRAGISGNKTGLLILSVAPNVVLSLSAIMHHYGDKFSIQPPSPHGGPRNTGYTYQQPWGKMTFVIAENNRLESVILDRSTD